MVVHVQVMGILNVVTDHVMVTKPMMTALQIAMSLEHAMMAK